MAIRASARALVAEALEIIHARGYRCNETYASSPPRDDSRKPSHVASVTRASAFALRADVLATTHMTLGSDDQQQRPAALRWLLLRPRLRARPRQRRHRSQGAARRPRGREANPLLSPPRGYSCPTSPETRKARKAGGPCVANETPEWTSCDSARSPAEMRRESLRSSLSRSRISGTIRSYLRPLAAGANRPFLAWIVTPTEPPREPRSGEGRVTSAGRRRCSSSNSGVCSGPASTLAQPHKAVATGPA